MINSSDKEILEKANNWIKTNHKVILATVVQTWGSSPQPVGSRMVINETGDFSAFGGIIEFFKGGLISLLQEKTNIILTNKKSEFLIIF